MRRPAASRPSPAELFKQPSERGNRLTYSLSVEDSFTILSRLSRLLKRVHDRQKFFEILFEVFVAIPSLFVRGPGVDADVAEEL